MNFRSDTSMLASSLDIDARVACGSRFTRATGSLRVRAPATRPTGGAA